MTVRMVSGALRHALAPRSDNDLNLIPRVRVRGRSGRWLALYGSLTEPSGDRPGETVIVIGPAKPEEVAWLNVAAYGLSPREEEVVGLLVRGFTNRQISQHPLHLRAHRPATPLQHLREGRRQEPQDPHETPILREPPARHDRRLEM